MTETSFYVLATDTPQQRYLLACKLTEKVYKLNQTVLILASSEAEAQTLDNLLWSFRQGSFVPHNLVDPDQQQPPEPVLIATRQLAEQRTAGADLLINLDTELPNNLQAYPRIAEIVDQQQAVKLAGRQRYKAYQAQNIKLTTHKL